MDLLPKEVVHIQVLPQLDQSIAIVPKVSLASHFDPIAKPLIFFRRLPNKATEVLKEKELNVVFYKPSH